MNDGLKDEYRQAIIAILSANPRVERVVLFGSRAMGTFTTTSDVDLALFGRELTLDDLAELAEKITDLPMPQRVDLLIHHRIESKNLLDHIKRHGVEWFRRKNISERTSGAGAEWERVPIADVIELISGGTPKTSVSEYWGGSIPWLSVGDFNTGYRWVNTAEKTITERGLAESATTILNRGDIIISARGTVGVVAQVALPMAFNQSCYGIRGRQGIAETNFVYYALRHAVSQMQQVAHGGVFNTITRDTFKIIKTTLPPFKEQQAIACILGGLDDKIELNRRMNWTLEAMARALFKSWFVDFDPVRAKAAGQQPPGLKPEIAALFPDSFEDSELGEIPKGWRVQSLPRIFEINPTRTLPKGTPAPHLDMASMPTQGPSPDSWIMREFGSGMKFINGDTLVARITPCLENGKTACVDFLADGEVGWGSTEYIVFRPKGSIPPVFAYLLARTDEFRNFAIQQMTGSSGRQRVPATSLEKYKIATPSIDSPLFTYFGNVVSPMFDRIKAAMIQSRSLTALRDTLLPKLISGELRVPDAERIAGRFV